MMRRDQVIISIIPFFDPDSGTWKVVCTVSGLKTEAQALRAADHMTAMFCGEEVPEVRQ